MSQQRIRNGGATGPDETDVSVAGDVALQAALQTIPSDGWVALPTGAGARLPRNCSICRWKGDASWTPPQRDLFEGRYVTLM